MATATAKGRWVVLEGPDGSGKTTQAALLQASLRAAGIPAESFRDPGTTEAGERLREILKGSAPLADPRTTLLLFTAARLELLAQRIVPALEAGAWVVQDRWSLSTWAYQVMAADPAAATGQEMLWAALQSKIPAASPDLTILLAGDPAVFRSRRLGRGPQDRFEAGGISDRAALAYAGLADKPAVGRAMAGSKRFVAVDAERATSSVTAKIFRAVADAFLENGRLLFAGLDRAFRDGGPCLETAETSESSVSGAETLRAAAAAA